MGDFVNTLISSGLDAFTNLYDIEFNFPTILISGASEFTEGMGDQQAQTMFKIRAGDFNAPQPRLAQYMTDYKTIQITRVAPMMEFERRFDINFRVDANYYIYHILKRWSFIYHDMMEGGINLPTGDETDILGKINVKAYTPNGGEEVMSWVFNKALCNKVTEPNFSRAGTEPVVATASFMFFDYLPEEGASTTQLQGTLAE